MINTILLTLILVVVLLKTNRNYNNIIESKLWEIERTMIKKEVHKNIECPKCGGEGFVYMEKIHSDDDRLFFIEDPKNFGSGNAYCRDCNGHGELTHDNKIIYPAVWID